MLKKVSSIFALTAALATASAFAQESTNRGADSARAVTANKVVLDSTKKLDVVDTAAEAGSFKTLTSLLKEAELVETLKGTGPFTVFAPTDEAFAKLPKGAVESLLNPQNREKLIAILKYHVVPGTVMAADIAKMKIAKTINGESLSIKTQENTVMVNNAKVTKPDIACTNGVIHVIDTVLMPKE
ncbi:MAG TPA: fasciclin domain-containing protein [Pirellulales bacterium]|nr:fasciclin domain-containing protein [Pirellulales bacterium]